MKHRSVSYDRKYLIASLTFAILSLVGLGLLSRTLEGPAAIVVFILICADIFFVSFLIKLLVSRSTLWSTSARNEEE